MNIGKKLDQYLSSWEEFTWSTSNCCHFGAGWMEVCGLGNPMASITESLTNISAYRIINEHGGFAGAVSHFLGKSHVGMPQLKIGDLVLFSDETGRGSLGIVCGRHAAYCAEKGVEFHNLEFTQIGWRIQP